jgi:hypothetical protein
MGSEKPSSSPIPDSKIRDSGRKNCPKQWKNFAQTAPNCLQPTSFDREPSSTDLEPNSSDANHLDAIDQQNLVVSNPEN